MQLSRHSTESRLSTFHRVPETTAERSLDITESGRARACEGERRSQLLANSAYSPGKIGEAAFCGACRRVERLVSSAQVSDCRGLGAQGCVLGAHGCVLGRSWLRPWWRGRVLGEHGRDLGAHGCVLGAHGCVLRRSRLRSWLRPWLRPWSRPVAWSHLVASWARYQN